MAPKGGRGGGGRGGGGISSCPGAFSDTYSQVAFANVVLFFAVFVGISIGLCTVRKKAGATGSRLLAAPYALSVFLFILGYGLELIAAVLQECGTADSSTYFGIYIATNIFYYLAYWLLLFVVVYTLNTMLREHLGGMTSVYKVIYIAILGFMFALTVAQIGISSYNLWTQTNGGYDANAEPIIQPAEGLRIAYIVFYLVSVLVSGALSLQAIFAMRSRRLPGGDLLGWVIALIFAMVLWNLLSLVFAATYLQNEPLEFDASAGLSYVLNFFQALSFIFILCIAKHVAWTKTAAATTTPVTYAPVDQQPTYAYTAPAGQQQYYYQQQAPVYNSTVPTK
ncbi:hypothetical protein IQ07DRAFT_403499 [Pyrenochaeta sp. DS3sAY3a]|nr:hypothetical protein IQ07DRAFT_403499 [Pyrenochaeta sp. DS3sAY3a]